MLTGHLFAGAGGGLLADKILGHQPVFAVELDSFACAVLREHAACGWFPRLHVHEGDIRMFDPSEYAGRVDCIHAGFPCQDISVAGRGGGIEGERSGLWTEVVRVVDAIRPAKVFLENSPAIVSRGLVVVLADLAALGFDVKWCVLPASAIGAPHLRARWFCLATHPNRDDQQAGIPQPCGRRQLWTAAAGQSGPDVANADRKARRRPKGLSIAGDGGETIPIGPTKPRRRGCEVADTDGEGLPQREGEPCDDGAQQPPALGTDWWATEPDVGRVADGVASRVDRLRCIGNGQVPLQAAVAYLMLGGVMATTESAIA